MRERSYNQNNQCEVCQKKTVNNHFRCRSHRMITDEMKENYKKSKIISLQNGTWKNQYGKYKEDRNSLQRYGDDNKDRRSSIYRDWRKEVWKRDIFKCKINNKDCNGRLEAHHILSYTDYPELRYNINNGITLCHAHHPRKRAEEKRLSPYFKELVSVSKEIF